MGAGLSQPSATYLPCPNNKEDKARLEALGVEFILEKEQIEYSSDEYPSDENENISESRKLDSSYSSKFPKGNFESGKGRDKEIKFREKPFVIKRNTMVRVKLPENWGLWGEWNRGDIIKAKLVDASGRKVASIDWMSKGSYDNICSIRVLDHSEDDGKRLDVSRVTLNKSGWYRVEPSLKNQYHDIVNSYYELHYRGGHQNDLDKEYYKLKEFEKVNQVSEKDLINYKRLVEEPNQLQGAITAVAISFAAPFPYEDPAPWIEVKS